MEWVYAALAAVGIGAAAPAMPQMEVGGYCSSLSEIMKTSEARDPEADKRAREMMLSVCRGFEEQGRERLVQSWDTFSAEARRSCLKNSARMKTEAGISPGYVVLEACLRKAK